MKTIKEFNKVLFYIVCAVVLSAGLVSCESDDSDVSRLISGGSEGPEPEKPFAMEGTWVAGNTNLGVTLTVLGQNIELGETIEGLVLGILNDALPMKLTQLSDLEIALKIEPGKEAGMAKLSSPTLDILTGSQNLAFELPKTDPFIIHSEGGLALLLKELTLLDYVTDTTPDGILVSESPLAGMGEMLGEKATLQSIKFACDTSLFEVNVSEEDRTGTVTLTLNGKLKINTKNSGLVGIFLKSAKTVVNLNLGLKQWTALN